MASINVFIKFLACFLGSLVLLKVGKYKIMGIHEVRLFIDIVQLKEKYTIQKLFVRFMT